LSATQKLVALLAAAVLVVGLMVLASFQAFTQIEDGTSTRRNAYELLVRANALMRDVTEAEAAQRSLVGTGKEALPQPSLAVSIRTQLGEMRPLISS
jgi:CHASE3 domain sensor protein